MRDTQQEQQDLDRRFQEINNKLDYLGIKGIEREQLWQQEHRKTHNMISASLLLIICTIFLVGWIFSAA